MSIAKVANNKSNVGTLPEIASARPNKATIYKSGGSAFRLILWWMMASTSWERAALRLTWGLSMMGVGGLWPSDRATETRTSDKLCQGRNPHATKTSRTGYQRVTNLWWNEGWPVQCRCLPMAAAKYSAKDRVGRINARVKAQLPLNVLASLAVVPGGLVSARWWLWIVFLIVRRRMAWECRTMEPTAHATGTLTQECSKDKTSNWAPSHLCCKQLRW